MARSVDAGILLQEGAPERGEQYLPEDFLLREGATTIGGTLYYSLCSPKLPGRGLALRVNTLEIVLEESFFFFFVCGVAGEEQPSFSSRSGFCEEFAGSPSPERPNTRRE